MADYERSGVIEGTVAMTAGILLLLSVLVLFSGCGSARRTEPVAGPLSVPAADLTQGRKLFMRNCDQCHPRGEAGLAPALNNKFLPAFLIKFQVRRGLGAMPSFSKDDLSDQQLDDIIRYLQALRNHQ